MEANLFLYHYTVWGERISIHRMEKGWTELGATWYEPCQGCEPWWEGWNGGNYAKEASDTRRVKKKGWYFWNVTEDVKLILAGTPNHGWFLKSAVSRGNDPTPVNFFSRETDHKDLRPYLKIRFRFSPPPLVTLSITSPKNNDMVLRSDVRVEGGVTNATGSETGVVVNGIIANVSGNQFTANHVPLTEGLNTITATATDVNGNTGAVSVTVNAVKTDHYIRIAASSESGISPFDTVLTIESSLDLTNASLTYQGPGEVELVSTSANEYRVKITKEGTYNFTARVTDSAGTVYEDTVGVTVFSKEEIDTLLREKWEGMTAKLASGDIEGSLDYFHEAKKTAYRKLLNALASVLPAIARDMSDIQLIEYTRDSAIYDIRTIRDGKEYSFQLLFTKDSNGIWRIHSF